MSTLTLRFPAGNADVGGLDSLAKTLQACSKVAATLEHGQRLQNISERLFFIQHPATHLDSATHPSVDLTASRPRRSSSIPQNRPAAIKRADSFNKSGSAAAVKLSSIFNDDFSPTALLSTTSTTPSNTVEIPLDELFESPLVSERALTPPKGQAVSSKRSAAPPRKSATTTATEVSVGKSVNVADIANMGGKAMCANCGATHTPLWRRGLNDELNCNACGLYCKLHKRPRPRVMKAGSTPTPRPQVAYNPEPIVTEPVVTVSAVCHNCQTTSTPLWRKNENGQNVCNACGLYHKLHGEARPVSMKADVVRKRSRHDTSSGTRSPKSIPIPARQYTKPQLAGLKINVTPVSYERSSSLSAGATPRKRSFADNSDDENERKRQRGESDVAGLMGELQKLESTLVDLQRRGEQSGRLSGRNSDAGGEGADVDMDARQEGEGYERRASYVREYSPVGRPSPLRQLASEDEPVRVSRHVLDSVFDRDRSARGYSHAPAPAYASYSASSSRSVSPVGERGYYASSRFAKDADVSAYARSYDAYDQAPSAIPHRYRRQLIDI